MHRKPLCLGTLDYNNQSIIYVNMDKKNTCSANLNSMRHPSVYPSMVIHIKIGSKIVLLLHLALRVLAPRTRQATSRSDLPSNLSLTLSEPSTEPDHLLLDLLNP